MRSLFRSTLFRSFPLLFLLAVLPLLSRVALADVLTVGPIYVSGGGIYWPHDPNQDGEVPGLSFGASGSNGVDSVSFGGDADTGGILAALQNPATAVGYTFAFGGGGPLGCFNGTGNGISTCQANIDGIRGVPEFLGIGRDFGLVQVYQAEPFPNTNVGPLLAQAYVVTTNVITNVDYLGGPVEFAMVSPEPRTGLLALIGLLGIVAVFRTKSRVPRW